MSGTILRLLAASTNPGKLRDFRVAADAADAVTIGTMPGLEAIAEPDEDEQTFEGNARIKAIYYSRYAPGEVVIADDSGLEVDALNGAPGVRSARYADDCGFGGAGSVNERNNLCLVAALREVSAMERKGRYRCVLAASRDGEILAVGAGSVEGRILDTPQGSGGFGYDPYFVPEGSSQSMAELDDAVRITLSHRGRALRDLLPRLIASRRILTRQHDFAQ